MKPVFRKDKDSAWKIVNSKAHSSKASSYWSSLFSSTDTHVDFLDRHFDFDYYLFTSPVYRKMFFPRAQSDNTDAAFSTHGTTNMRNDANSVAEAISVLTGTENIIGDRDSMHDTICGARLGDRDSSVVQVRPDGSISYQLSEKWPPLTVYNGSKHRVNKKSHAANAKFDRMLRGKKRVEQRTINVLLLGTMF